MLKMDLAGPELSKPGAYSPLHPQMSHQKPSSTQQQITWGFKTYLCHSSV